MNSSVTLGYPLYISNKYRNTSNDLPFDFIAPDVSGILGLGRQYTITLLSTTFTNNFNVVVEDKNDQFIFMVNNVKFTNTIEAGYYDIYTFLDEINAALTNAFVGLVATYDDVDRSIVWTVPAECTFMLVREYISSRGGINVDSYLYPARDDRFLELCGALQQGNVAYAGPTTFESGSPVNLYGTRLIHINLGTELGVLTPTFTRTQTIASVPVTVERGQVEYWQSSHLIGHKINGEQLQNLRIYATDEWEHIIDDVPANTLWHLTFLLTPV